MNEVNNSTKNITFVKKNITFVKQKISMFINTHFICIAIILNKKFGAGSQRQKY